jgi:hypothetical protein
MTGWGLFWSAFAALGLTAEFIALFNRSAGDTASENVWKVLRIADPRPSWLFWPLRAGVALACIWLAGHFSMGWWTTGG